ncbi:MAG: hypothetical protein DHS20C21_07700 [Gemmatimonadota bacterium]|nr:MAG: hypothetical protein DHS20C21_07700 [Gemmatimonadota bacterium]
MTARRGGSVGSLQILDLSNPAAPKRVGFVETRGAAKSVSLSGSYAYVLSEGWGVEVADVSDPTFPRILGGVPYGGCCLADAVAAGGSVYLAASAGILILAAHCEKPVPVLLSGFTAMNRDQAVELSWFTSFESAHEGFHVYRSGQLASGYSRLNDRLLRGRSPYSYLDSTVRPMTTYYYQLGAVDLRGQEVLHPPTSVTTLPARSIRTALAPGSPNPFRRKTALSFTLAKADAVTLAIYDVTGRLVREVIRDDLPEGEHTASWNGRDDAGLRVAGGPYFVRLMAGGESRAEKVVFLGE